MQKQILARTAESGVSADRAWKYTCVTGCLLGKNRIEALVGVCTSQPRPQKHPHEQPQVRHSGKGTLGTEAEKVLPTVGIESNVAHRLEDASNDTPQEAPCYKLWYPV